MGCSRTCGRGNPGHGSVLILDRFPIVQLSTQGLTWLQKKSGLLLILPFAHLCVCVLYLAVYFYIFGYNLSTFADAGDVFSVSFTNIAPFYVSAIFGIGSNATIDFESRETGPDPSNGCLLLGVILPASALWRRNSFDILGSGWMRVGYGMVCPGFEGRAWQPSEMPPPDADGEWLRARINDANLAESRRIWRLVDPG